MEEIIKIEERGGIQTVSARDLWEGLESKQEFAHWIKDRLEGFVCGQDFLTILAKSTGGRPCTEYHLTLDTAKHLAMLERNEQGKAIRQYFIEVEKRARAVAIPQTYAEALQLAADQAREIEAKTAALAIAAPKAEFYDQVVDSKDAIDMRTAAAVLNIPGLGRNKLFDRLRALGVLDQDNKPYRKFQDAGYFRVIETKYTDQNGDTHINTKTLVYQRGIDFIRKAVKA